MAEETKSAPGFDLVAKAISFGLKIWSPTKLESVLARCIDQPPVNKSILPCQQTAAPRPQRALTRLLQSEKIHGSTERDPTQKRHDYRYFSRAAYFVLVEDLRQELATLIAHEYPPSKRDGSLKTPWPTLHCHPHSRGPFIVFDEKEKKRWEKMQQNGKSVKVGHTDRGKRNDCDVRIETMKNAIHAKSSGKPGADLRRSVSLNNLRRQISHEKTAVVDISGFGDNVDHVNASGYLASGPLMGYMAASGNSVGLTSTTGTTSTSGYFLRNGPLPSALVGQIKKEVVTSRKFPSANKLQPATLMGPPKTVPDRQPVLKKSKSTNTFKLPRREEGSKPGYCESCRQKFDDFKLVRHKRNTGLGLTRIIFSMLVDGSIAHLRRKLPTLPN
jgi:regulatory subunit for Cdc7p protein kinase